MLEPRSLLGILPMILVVIVAGMPATSAGPEPITDTPAFDPGVGLIIEPINVYHDTFSRPGWTGHPSTYIPGYPEDAKPLFLSLDAPTLEQAMALDADTWANLEDEQMYYVPGTNVVGILTFDNRDSPYYEYSPWHGTAVADAFVGSNASPYPGGAIVSIVGPWLFRQAAEYFRDNEWIDLFSSSMSCGTDWEPGTWAAGPEVLGWHLELASKAAATYEAWRGGRINLNSAKNSEAPPICDWSQVPWTISVVMVEQSNEADGPRIHRCDECEAPYELGAISLMEVASHESLNDTWAGHGSSLATPHVAARALDLITTARAILGDTDGFSNGLYAQAPAGANLPTHGPLADGDLTREELENLLFMSTQHLEPELASGFVEGMYDEIFGSGFVSAWVPYQPFPETPWPEEHMFLYDGYGYYTNSSHTLAKAVLHGEATLPTKPHDDLWKTRIDAYRWAYFGPTIVCRELYPVEEFASCTQSIYETYVIDVIGQDPLMPSNPVG